MLDRRKRPSPAELYRRLWVSEQSPNLEDYLSNLPILTPDELLDVIETDRTERWRRGDRVTAERYLRDYPAIRNDAEAALVVIYGEYFLRKEFGESPSLMEYLARFPRTPAGCVIKSCGTRRSNSARSWVCLVLRK